MGLTAAQAAKLGAADEIVARLTDIVGLVRQEFEPASPPIAVPAAVPSLEQFEATRVAEAKAATSFFNRKVRRAALQIARAEADDDRRAAVEEAQEQARRNQSDLDGLWQQLCSNDPEAVVQTLNDAFADNEAPAVCVGVSGDRAGILVVAPDLEDVVPDRRPTATDSGNLSLRKMSKTDRNMYYAAVLYGHLLVSVKEAFAVAPGLRSAVVTVVSRPGTDVYGNSRTPDALVAAGIERTALEGVRWDDHAGDEILPEVAYEVLVNRKGRAADFHPIDLTEQPGVAAVLQLLEQGS